MSETTYQGWHNYETWAVALWLDNEQGSQEEAREIATRPVHAWEAARDLKDWLDECMPDLGGTLWSDLLRSAFDSVDWHEVAEHYREEDE